MTAAYKHRRQQIDLIGELYFLRKYLDGNLHIFSLHVEQSRKEGGEGILEKKNNMKMHCLVFSTHFFLDIKNIQKQR